MSNQAKLSVKRKPSWVTSTFEDFDKEFKIPNSVEMKLTKTVSKKRSRSDFKKELKNTTTHHKLDVDVWVDKHKPKFKNDLAVHKKKILEVENWLNYHIEKSKQNDGPMLLLTGPAGAGKTATLHTLANEMHLEVQEWINPLTEVFQNDVIPDFSSRAGHTYQSQTTLFSDFLLRANRYQTLELFGEKSFKKKVIIIEDFPHTFLRQPQQLHSILRKYKTTGRSPLVFIISDTTRSDSIVRKLLPKELQLALNIQEISFNPVAPTSMCKVLTSIAGAEAAKGDSKFKVPCKSAIDALSTASAGDIRGAINALQFACLKDANTSYFNVGSQSEGTKSSKNTRGRRKEETTSNHRNKFNRKKEDKQEQNSLAAIGGRDTSMFLFRGLGKILYCKRIETDFEDRPSLPPHLQHYDRDKLKFNPEEVISQTQISSDMFNLYLHQNYLEFYNCVEDVVRASEYLSDADVVSTNWSHRSTLAEYSSCIATRGLIHCNSSRSRHNATGSLGWKPLHKPQWWQVNKMNRDNASLAKALFLSYCSTPIDLHTQLLPYLSRIKPPLNKPGQMPLLQELNSFSTKTRVERLNEKDVETPEEESCSQKSTMEENDSILESNLYDNDIDIGDFDDDNLIDDFYRDDNW